MLAYNKPQNRKKKEIVLGIDVRGNWKLREQPTKKEKTLVSQLHVPVKVFDRPWKEHHKDAAYSRGINLPSLEKRLSR